MALNLGPLNVMLRLQGAQQFTRQTKNAESALVGFGKAVGGTLVLQQLARQMVEATKVFAEFDRAMVRVGAVTNSLGTEAFAGLTERAKDLATTTEFTARQVADAMGFMGMAGMDVNKIYESTPAVLQLASAGMVDVASAADTVTNIMAGYGIEAKDLTKANNVLVATFTGSNTSLQSLGQSFKYAGSVAKNAGVEFKEAAAVIGLMGNAGIQADMAGTALRGAIIKLLKPTDEGANIMRRYGIEVKDSTGKLKSMVEIFRELEPIADDSALMVDLFGLRAGPGLQAALSQGSGALEKLIDKIDNAGNIAERVAEAQMNTLDGKIKEMKSNFEGLQIAIGKAFEPATIKTVELLSGKLNELSKIVREIGEAFSDLSSPESKESIQNLAASLNPFLMAVKRIRNAYSDAFPEEIGKVYGPDLQGRIDYMVRNVQQARQRLESAEAGFLAGTNEYAKVQQAVAVLEYYQEQLRGLRRELQLTALAQETGMSMIPDYSGMTIGQPAAIPKPPKKSAAEIAADEKRRFDEARQTYKFEIAVTDFEAAAAGLADVVKKIKPPPMEEITPEELMNELGFGDEIDISGQIEDLAKAAEKAADKFRLAGDIIYQIGSAATSGSLGSTLGTMLLGRIGSIVSQNLGDPTGATGAAIGSVLGQLFGGALDELINSLGVLSPLFDIVADILKAFSAPLIVLRAMFETFRDAVGIALIPILEMMASVMAKYLYQFLLVSQALMPWAGVFVNISYLLVYSIVPALDMLFSAATFLSEQGMIPLARGSIIAYNSLVNFVNGLTMWLRYIEIAGVRPFESFGVLMERLDVGTVQTYLDLISEENEARSEAAQGLREFNEELRNVPIGVKRIRGLQFSATSGRFNSPAWGA